MMTASHRFVGWAIASALLWVGNVHAQGGLEELVSVHTRNLGHEDPNVRSNAARSLGGLGTDGAVAGPALIQTLEDTNSSVRRDAATALAKIRYAPDAVLPALLRLACDDEEYARSAALDAIAELFPQTVTDVPGLVKRLHESDWRERRWAAEALVRLNRRALPALDELAAALKDEAAAVRSAAALALRNIRGRAKPAVPALIEGLEDSDPEVRENVAQALGWIGPGEIDAVPALITAIDDSHGPVRSNAARAFLTDWPEAERAIPALVGGLADRESSINAGYALRHIAHQGQSEVVVPTLLEFMEGADEHGLTAAANTLGQIGGDARAAIPRLREMTEHKDHLIRQMAAKALVRIDGADGYGVQALSDELQRGRFLERERAIISLGDLGPAAAPAVPALMSIIGDRREQALAEFEVAAEQGLAEAQFALAMLYRSGEGVDRDFAAAADWFRKAAQQGHAEARRHLGILYRQGRGVPRDDHQAEVWYRLSEQADNPLARLKRENFNPSAYERALSPHETGVSSTFVNEPPELLLAITRFNHDAIQAWHVQVDLQGKVNAFLDIYNWSRRGGSPHPYEFSPTEMNELRQLLARVPQGVEYAPVQQRLVVSARLDDKWTTRLYDREALPLIVRRILDSVGAPASSLPYQRLERRSWPSSSQNVQELAFQPDGTLLSWGPDGKLHFWREEELVETVHLGRTARRDGPVAISHDQSRVVMRESEQLRLLAMNKEGELADVEDLVGLRSGIPTFSRDGRTLAILQPQHYRIAICNGRTGDQRGVIQLDAYLDREPAISRDGSRLAFVGPDEAIHIWSLETMREEWQVAGSFRALAFSPDGRALGCITNDHLVVWDLETHKSLFQARADSWAELVRFSPDGKRVACTGRRRTIRLYESPSGRMLGLAEGHAAQITALTFSADGSELASASEDGIIKVWDVDDLIRAFGL